MTVTMTVRPGSDAGNMTVTVTVNQRRIDDLVSTQTAAASTSD